MANHLTNQDPLSFLQEALQNAQREAGAAQAVEDGRHMQDALVWAEEVIGDTLARLRAAADDDQTEAEESGHAYRQRLAWFSRYQAA